MSTPIDKKWARLRNVALALLSENDDRRRALKVERSLAIEAMDLIIGEATEIKMQLEQGCFFSDERQRSLDKANKAIADARAHEKRLAATRKTPQGRAAIEARRANWEALRKQKAAAKAATERDRAAVAQQAEQFMRQLSRWRQVADIFGDLYDNVLVQGKAVGDIWHSELGELRSGSAFETALIDEILAQGIPPAPARVRDYIGQKQLGAMTRRAVEAVTASAVA